MGIAGNCFPRRGTGNIDFKNMSGSLDDKEDSLRSIWFESFHASIKEWKRLRQWNSGCGLGYQAVDNHS